MEIRQERQISPVADDVSALVGVTRPILVGLLHSIGEEYLEVHGGREGILLKNLGRVRKANDGDLGIAFEYAVHDAILRQEPSVTDRISEALRQCRIGTDVPSSILFAMEKDGTKQLIDTKRDLITAESRVLSGNQGQPVKLQKYMNQLAAAFHKPSSRPALPRSIQGLWKADLFLGSPQRDHWVGTTIKVKPQAVEPARGLRIAVVPSTWQKSDRVRKDDQKNLIICPLPYDPEFMTLFYDGMQIIQQLVSHDFKMPSEPALPRPLHRRVAEMYVDRREFTIAEVVDALAVSAQPHLLESRPEDVGVFELAGSEAPDTSTAVSPMPLLT
ncbi:hypothetical protein M3C58_08565 [Brachybacterium muris]|uniref:hypothetical protein n=1 Tax=Brachybacterium muris TaxID=219301 RepID=UPI0021A4369D|nr:hypothetical protein [Brachybacterium muris]MCT1998244.1 hypothetical protein [Brachybacterium muris]